MVVNQKRNCKVVGCVALRFYYGLPSYSSKVAVPIYTPTHGQENVSKAWYFQALWSWTVWGMEQYLAGVLVCMLLRTDAFEHHVVGWWWLPQMAEVIVLMKHSGCCSLAFRGRSAPGGSFANKAASKSSPRFLVPSARGLRLLSRGREKAPSLFWTSVDVWYLAVSDSLWS